MARSGIGSSDANAIRAAALSSTCCCALALMGVAICGATTRAGMEASSAGAGSPASLPASPSGTAGKAARREVKRCSTPGQAFVAVWRAAESWACGASASVTRRSCCRDAGSVAEGHVAASAPTAQSNNACSEVHGLCGGGERDRVPGCARVWTDRQENTEGQDGDLVNQGPSRGSDGQPIASPRRHATPLSKRKVRSVFAEVPSPRGQTACDRLQRSGSDAALPPCCGAPRGDTAQPTAGARGRGCAVSGVRARCCVARARPREGAPVLCGGGVCSTCMW